MKNIFTLILLANILYLSSCTSSGGNNSTLIVTPVVDSQSKGGNVQVSFTNDSSVTESFFINDYTLNSKPGYSIYAAVTYNHTDSLWHLNLQSIDQKLSRMAITFTGTDTSALGTFTSTTSTSTLTDYTNGHTTTYSILVGSTVTITQSSYPIEGSFTFKLSRNYFTTIATGTFKIYY
jgi:hypothetical protein